MLLGGLWHGASWTFAVWGALHGIYLCAERFIQSRYAFNTAAVAEINAVNKVKNIRASVIPFSFTNKTTRRFMLAMLTFFLVNVAWVFFRAEDFTAAGKLLFSMFGLNNNGAALLPTIEIIKVTAVTVGLIATHWFMRDSSISQLVKKTKWWIVAIVWSLLLFAIVLSQKSSDSFIYFQF
jgi:alginate O-acetyltransferase complex protein AlgI